MTWAPNSIVAVWATGLGPITPPQPDGAVIGLPLGVNSLVPRIDAPSLSTPFGGTTYISLDITYAGPAPAFVAGVSQINFRLAPFVPWDGIRLRVGSAVSNGFFIYVAR